MASTKARLLKHDFPVHGFDPSEPEITDFIMSNEIVSKVHPAKNYCEINSENIISCN